MSQEEREADALARYDAAVAQARQREAEMKVKAAKATKAGSSINGAPRGSSTSALPADSIEEEVRRAWREAEGRV